MHPTVYLPSVNGESGTFRYIRYAINLTKTFQRHVSLITILQSAFSCNRKREFWHGPRSSERTRLGQHRAACHTREFVAHVRRSNCGMQFYTCMRVHIRSHIRVRNRTHALAIHGNGVFVVAYAGTGARICEHVCVFIDACVPYESTRTQTSYSEFIASPAGSLP